MSTSGLPSTSSWTTSVSTCRSHARHRWQATRSEPTGCSGKGHQLESYLHYRVVDVSSIKELARRWYPRVYFAAPPKTGNHRALADIQESIEELRYYRATVFVEPPGPDSDTARAHAAEHGGSLTAIEEDEVARTGRPREPTSRCPEHPFTARILFFAAPPRARRRSHGGCSSAGRAPGCGPGGRGFKSRHSPQADGPLTCEDRPGSSRLPTPPGRVQPTLDQSRPASAACRRTASLSGASTNGTSRDQEPATCSTRPSPGSSRTSRMYTARIRPG